MLTDVQCKQAVCPLDAKRARFSDSQGLYLEITPNGKKRWFWKYRIAKVEKRLALGSYPEVGLMAARKARDAAKIQKSDGRDPVEVRKIEKLKSAFSADETFKAVALEWYDKQVKEWSPGHAERLYRQLERDLFPFIGARPMPDIHAMELLSALQKVEERGAVETADRVLMLARQIWDYWLPTTDNTQRNITEGLKARLTPYRAKNFPAIVEPARFGELMRAIKQYRGGPIVRAALQLAPVLYQRPGNLRQMEWAEIDVADWSQADLSHALWTIPSIKMKRSVAEKEQGDDHVVPLPKQALTILKNLHPITGHGRYVFPGERDHERPLSDNSVRSALYALGFGKEQSWNGFRASARTMLVDQLDLDPLMIEANLAHAVKDANGRSYNRTQYLTKRQQMMQVWADYIEKLRDGAQVVALMVA